MKFLLALLLLFVTATPVAAFDSSLTLDQPNPVFDQSVTFTAIYPSEAAQTPKRSEQHYNPQVQLDCYQAGTHVLNVNQIMDTKNRITGGWNSTTYPITLSALPSNGLPGWSSGGADCSGTLYSYQSGVLTVWATTQFTVNP